VKGDRYVVVKTESGWGARRSDPTKAGHVADTCSTPDWALARAKKFANEDKQPFHVYRDGVIWAEVRPSPGETQFFETTEEKRP
jgi:hypothetical protein